MRKMDEGESKIKGGDNQIRKREREKREVHRELKNSRFKNTGGKTMETQVGFST